MGERMGKEEELILEELAIAEVGQPVDAEIASVLRGKCVEFPAVQKIRNEAIKQRWLERQDAECVQLIVRTDSIEYILFPIRISNNPRSTYYKILKTYGRKEGNSYKLKPGDKVKIVITERGFPRIYLPM